METIEEKVARLEEEISSLRQKQDARTGKHASHVQN
jgi:hypothetical protein